MPKVEITTEIELGIETAAKWFAALDDDSMCRFLVAVAKEAERYPGSPDNQWYHAYPVETHSRKNLLDVEVMYETRLG